MMASSLAAAAMLHVKLEAPKSADINERALTLPVELRLLPNIGHEPVDIVPDANPDPEVILDGDCDGFEEPSINA